MFVCNFFTASELPCSAAKRPMEARSSAVKDVYRISLNIGAGVYFLPASFDRALQIKLMYGTREFP